ncbi:Kinesin light chain [Fusarium odoratissimum]|uniref:Kinesin light chain n=1 Tax=Fusarium oxysporum f. sp. cubense (strain race 4) TaxID=2502994 RepID=N1RPY1_FUSC4|nr:Kinesin light chain [Fusarium odoratissimum]
MAEAVGLAASIIAIVELSAKVGKLCVQYSTAAGNARADITRLQNRLKDLNVCLEAAQRLLDDPKNTKLATSRSLVDSLNACETELAEVQDRLHPGSARKAMRRFGLRALKWPFNGKEISTVVSNLEHYKQTITLCLQVDQTTILLDMSQRVEGLSLQQQGETGIARAPCFNVPFDRDNDFVARPDMTAWLRDKYSSSTGRMALVGMGGFGKSQVAINFAYSINDEASDFNIFWVHASSKPRFEEAYRAIAERMKLPKRDEPSMDILALVRDWLQNDESGPWLMILDNADDINLFYPKGIDERSLASFLPKRHNGTILVTSRSLDVAERLTGSHKNIFQVSTMDEAQGLHLITNKLTGLAASIIAIVELSAKVGKLCVQYSTAAGNARADITRLQNRLKDLNVCLEAAQRLLDDPKNTKLATSRSLVDSLNACETELAEVQDRLHPGSARKAMRRFGLRALKWPFNGKEISTVVSNLEHYKQTITLCLQVDQTTILLDMSQRVEGLSLQQQGETGIARAPCFNVPFDRDNDFVARPDMTAWLRDKYSSSTGRMALVGMGGFGKSQVAINFAYSINDEASDFNIFWVHASSKPRFEEAYRAIAERMKLPKRDEPSMDILALVRDWLQNDESGPWLMILDNADDINLFYPKGIDERSLASFLPKRHNGTILVTSRSLDVAERLTGSHKNIFQVSTMDEAQGLHLITNKLTGEFEHGAAVELLQALDYIPLAITQAAAYINRRSPRESVESYLEAFQESDQKKNSLLEVDLGDLRRDETVSNSVITTWQVTFEKIRHERPSAANLLSFMSLFDHKGIPEFALHYYNGEPADSKDKVDGFEDDLDVLRSYSLVSVTAVRDVFELHATVQTCTRAWISSSDTLPKLKRLFLISMCRNFDANDFKYRRQGRFKEAENALLQIVDIEKRNLGEEHPETLVSMNNLAITYLRQRRYDEAEELLVRLITVRKSTLGDRSPEILSLTNNLVSLYSRQGLYEKAEKMAIELLEASRIEMGLDDPDTLVRMNNLAWIYWKRGRLGEAHELQKQVLAEKTKVLGKDHPGTIGALALGASIMKDMGHRTEALSLQQACVDGYRESLGPEHPKTVAAVQVLAWWEAETGLSEQ